MSGLRQFILANRPVRYWPLDEALVNGSVPSVARELCAGANGTPTAMETADFRRVGLVGAVHLDSPEGAGRGGYYCNTDDYVALPSSMNSFLALAGQTANGRGFTISVFFTQETSLRWDAIYAERFGAAATNIVKLEMQDFTQIGLSVFDNGGSSKTFSLTGVSVADLRLHLIQIERDNATGVERGYLDGKLWTSASITWGTNYNAGMVARIGSDPSDSAAYWSGLISHLALFDRPIGLDFHMRLWDMAKKTSRPASPTLPRTRVGR